MQPKVSKGLATWAGIVAAFGQYAAAVAVFLDDPEKATALGPLATATATLALVIYGRMSQARDQIKAPPPQPVLLSQAHGGIYETPGAPKYYFGSGTAVSNVETTYAGTSPRPHAYVSNPDVDPDPPDAMDRSIADPELDDPEFALPTREQHSQLKG